MEGPRIPSNLELPHVFEFLNTHLRPHVQWSIDHEYPTALTPANIGNIRIIKEGQQVVSHAVLRPLIVKSPTIIFKIAAIGSVVTDEKFRGQGYSTKILQECLNEAQRQDCDIAMLWTNLYDYYRKLNFELAGFEESIVFEKEFTTPDYKLKFMNTKNVSTEAIAKLYSQHTIASVRTQDDFKKYLNIPNTTLYTAWEANGSLAAYAVEGKGADLTGYIHEWGGSVSRLMSLLSWIRKEKKTSFTIIMAQHSLNLLTALKTIPGVVHNEGYLGMIKIIHREQLFNKIKKSALTVGIQDLVLQEKDGKFIFGLGKEIIEFTDEKDLVRILFGPMPEIPNFTEETMRKLERVLPVHLWIWGWDSI